MTVEYAELHCLSNFSFQRGASSALELCRRAKEQGYRALAITDECTLAGIVRAWQAARELDLHLIVGSEIQVEHGPKLVLLVENLEGYQALCRLITRARRRSEKGRYRIVREDFDEPLPGLLALWVPMATMPKPRAAGSSRSLPVACGYRCSCTAGRTTASAWRTCWPWPGASGSPLSPRATCTCTCVAVGPCRTP